MGHRARHAILMEMPVPGGSTPPGRGSLRWDEIHVRRALSDNFLSVELAREREPNLLIDVEVGGLTAGGLREREPLRVLG